jgi:hypothetical protein
MARAVKKKAVKKKKNDLFIVTNSKQGYVEVFTHPTKDKALDVSV